MRFPLFVASIALAAWSQMASATCPQGFTALSTNYNTGVGELAEILREPLPLANPSAKFNPNACATAEAKTRNPDCSGELADSFSYHERNTDQKPLEAKFTRVKAKTGELLMVMTVIRYCSTHGGCHDGGGNGFGPSVAQLCTNKEKTEIVTTFAGPTGPATITMAKPVGQNLISVNVSTGFLNSTYGFCPYNEPNCKTNGAVIH